MKARIPQVAGDALGLEVHAVDMPVGVSQDVLAQVMADEAIDAEDENVFQNLTPAYDILQVSATGCGVKAAVANRATPVPRLSPARRFSVVGRRRSRHTTLPPRHTDRALDRDTSRALHRAASLGWQAYTR